MHDTEGETIEDVRRQRDELGIQLGIQLAALRERLRLAMDAVGVLRGIAADCSARATYARGFEDGQAAEKTRADEMEAVAERWEDRYYKMCSEVNAAEARTDALGIQLAAAQERLRLAMAVVDAARYGHPSIALRTALAAFDAVPGDTLDRP
jgi:hypothetical protein